MVNVVMADGVRATSARLVRWFYRSAALVFVCAFAAPLPALAQSSWQRYSGTTTVFIPYANTASNSSLSQTPTVNVGFNGLSHFTAIGMDTGSTGLIASSDIFVPAAGAQNLGPGQQTPALPS